MDYTDFSKESDRIDHKLLLLKLDNHAFSTSLVNLFAFYLSNGSQYLTFNSFISNAYAARSSTRFQSRSTFIICFHQLFKFSHYVLAVKSDTVSKLENNLKIP